VAAFTDHLKPVLLVNGSYQVKTQSITVNGVSGNQAVETLEGLVGKTPGAKRANLSATFAVETGGLEFDFWSTCSKGDYIDLQVPIGAKSIIGGAWIDDCSLSGSSGASTEFSINAVMEFNELQ